VVGLACACEGGYGVEGLELSRAGFAVDGMFGQ
jgi:hypothetical protein